MKITKTIRLSCGALLCGLIFSSFTFAQSTRKAKASATVVVGGTAGKAAENAQSKAVSSRVQQIDAEALKKVLTPNGKPLLVNFWATWCDPCRDEFPDLVTINEDYKGKLDMAAVSLDDLAEINHDVPAFLTQMKAEMPAYLLKVPDEDAVISTVSKDWQGGLPFSILYDAAGKIIYTKMGKVDPKALRMEIDKLLNPA